MSAVGDGHIPDMPELTKDQIDWSKAVGALMNEAGIREILIPPKAISELTENGLVLVFENRPDGIKLMLLPALEAMQYHNANKKQQQR